MISLDAFLEIATPEPTTGCMLWTRTGRQYGQMKQDGKNYMAHRLSFLLANGFLPEVVMHACDNPACVNPRHLRAGTHVDNVADRHRKGRTRNGTTLGSKRPAAKLTEADIPKICRCVASGQSVRSTARQFGIGYTTARTIIAGTAWRHVPREAAP